MLFDRLQVLFFGEEAGSAEIHILLDGKWTTEVIESTPRSTAGPQSRIVGIEVEDTANLRAALENRLADLEDNEFHGCYVALPDRSSAALVSRMISDRSLGRFDLYGVDPDYYYGLVPLSGRGRRQVESFVLGLKPASSLEARTRLVLKRLLIRIGLSARFYDTFIVVLEGVPCS